MIYELVFFVLGTMVLAGGLTWFFKVLELRVIHSNTTKVSLNTTKLVIKFVTISLSKRFNSKYKLMYYTDLIINALDYMYMLSEDISLNEKTTMAMNKIFKASNDLKIKLTIEEKIVIKEILITAYEMYISCDNEID